MYEYNTVNVEILNSIAVVKFNRPKALNALSTEMTKELSDLFDKLALDGSVRGIILTGKRINADEAEKIGLVNKVVSYEELMDEAMNSLGTALRNSSVALKYAKEAIDTGMSLDLNSGIKVEINSAGMVFASEDKNEGVTAFLEKRKPNFKNK